MTEKRSLLKIVCGCYHGSERSASNNKTAPSCKQIIRQLYRIDSVLASSTAACNLSLAVRIAESDDKLEGSTSIDGVAGIGVTSGAVTKSGATKGVEV